MTNISVLISGSGTNLQALLDAQERGDMPEASFKLVISNAAGAFGLERANKAGVETKVISSKDTSFLLKVLRESETELIVLAGYLPILPRAVTDEFCGKILNIHPSLIPSFCGKGYYGIKTHQAVIDAGVKITGATAHFVDAGVDTGMILIQEAVSVKWDDTPQSLQRRVLAAEHRILVAAVKAFTENRVVISENHCYIEDEMDLLVNMEGAFL
ncbi:MAG: phosphoribosylglycinamide formyltransferase [Clostridiales bacterium]|nr:phosphoribosylglycinamide formyltransferase [Clostridiales bacterium]